MPRSPFPPPIRRGTRALVALALVWAALGLTLADALAPHPGRDAAQAAGRELAGRLGLTDPALFNEARYTRHPSQADRHAAFQDHPLALEHFPSGSLVPPPMIGP